MKRACLVSIGLVAAFFAGYAWLLHGRVEAPGSLVLAFLCAIFAAVFVGSVVTFRRDRRLENAFFRAQRGSPPVDGELGVASGEIYPVGEALLTPFDRMECVAYEYDILPPKDSTRGGSEYTGVALAPSVIRTDRGSFSVLGWTMLDDFQKRRLETPAAFANAEEYLAATTFERLSLLDVLSQLDGLLSDDDGSIRKDWRIVDKGPPSLEGRRLQERHVPVGATVTLTGVYSAARGGFVSPKGSAEGNQLLACDARRAREKLSGKATSGLVIGLVLFLLSHGFLLAILLGSSR